MHKAKVIAGLLIGASTAGWTTAAWGQAATAPTATTGQDAAPPAATATDADGTGDIIVTALKRTDTIQNTPATISVVSSDQIKASNINTIEQLGSLVPGVIVQRPPNNTANATIRGIGTSPGPVAFEQGVAMFVDGVYAARGADFLSSLFDIERIEVVKGTQAAVLGKNTSLGAITLTTRKPGDHLAVDALASYEFQRDSTVLSGGIDIPLGDTLAVRVAGQYQDLGGFARNRFDNGIAERTARQTNEAAGRITAVWKPRAGLSVTLNYSHEFLRNLGIPGELQVGSPAALAAYTAAGLASLYETNLDYRYASNGTAGGPTRLRQFYNRATGTIDLDLGSATMTSISGWSKFNQARWLDYDYTPGDFFDDHAHIQGEQFSQELRLSSDNASPFQYLVGGLYVHNTLVQNLYQSVHYPVNPRGAFQGLFDQRTDTWSAFAQPSYDITDRFTVIGGVRFTSEKKVAFVQRTTLIPGSYTTVQYPPFALTRLERNETAVDGSVTARFKPTQGVMLYASWGQGTKGGGFSDYAIPANAPYAPEVARTIEAGFKLGGGSRNWSLDGAYFHTRVAGFQNSLFNGSVFVTQNLHIASDGVELQAGWSPLSDLRFNLEGTYADTRNLDQTPGLDNRMPRSPRLSGKIGGAWSPDLNARLKLNLSGDFSYRSRISHQLNPVAVPFGAAFPQVNATIGVRDRVSGLELSLIGRNLNNALSSSFAFPAPNLPGAVIAIPEEPRTIALQIRVVR